MSAIGLGIFRQFYLKMVVAENGRAPIKSTRLSKYRGVKLLWDYSWGTNSRCEHQFYWPSNNTIRSEQVLKRLKGREGNKCSSSLNFLKKNMRVNMNSVYFTHGLCVVTSPCPIPSCLWLKLHKIKKAKIQSENYNIYQSITLQEPIIEKELRRLTWWTVIAKNSKLTVVLSSFRI